MSGASGGTVCGHSRQVRGEYPKHTKRTFGSSCERTGGTDHIQHDGKNCAARKPVSALLLTLLFQQLHQQ